MQLSHEQEAIIAHQQGHAKVIAVAGAGKTTTLSHFILQRLAEGVPAKRIMVLMYNRSTQQDFTQRLTTMTQQAIPEVRTFHSLGLRIYRSLIQRQALPNFDERILSGAEIESVVWRILQKCAPKVLKAEILEQRQIWVEPALEFFEQIKSSLLEPEQVFEQQKLPKKSQFFIQAFQQYEQWRKQQGRISYTDMLYDPCMAFKQDENLIDQFSGHMQFILVDEFQDINDSQQFLLDVLLAKRGYLIAIGDPDQTIYEFRGSRTALMLDEFDQRYPEYTAYTLSRSFRYGQHLALSVNHLITHNKQRENVLSVPFKTQQMTEVFHYECFDYAKYTVKMLRGIAEEHSLKDVVILNRLWQISAPLELALLTENISYAMDNTVSVLDRAELKNFIMLAKIADKSFHELSKEQRLSAWKQFLNTPFPKVKREDLDNIAKVMVKHKSRLNIALLNAIPEGLSKWQQQQLADRAEVLFAAEKAKKTAKDLYDYYIDMLDYYNGIRELAFSAKQVEDKISTIKAFVHYCGVQKIASKALNQHLSDLKERRANNQSQDAVTISSIHKAKGLEWPVVIIPGLNDYNYPYLAEDESLTEARIESERRLLYVAMTRAIEQLYLLSPKSTMKREQASPFLKEMDSENCKRLAQQLVLEPAKTIETKNLSTVSLQYLQALDTFC